METKQDLTILVVDNHPVGVKVLERTMHKEVYQVITADDGPRCEGLLPHREYTWLDDIAALTTGY